LTRIPLPGVVRPQDLVLVPLGVRELERYREMPPARLYERGAKLKARLDQIDQERTSLLSGATAERSRLLEEAPWIGLHCTIVLVALLTAPISHGISLLIEIPHGPVLIGEIALFGRAWRKFSAGSYDHTMLKLKTHQLAMEAAEIDEHLFAIRAELEGR
jgi:hypothetical protein